MEHGGRLAAGDRGALRVSPAGAVRRRDRDQDGRTDAVAGAHGVSTTRWSRREDQDDRGVGHDRARGARSVRQAVPAAASASARCSHEGARHRRRRLHRVASDGGRCSTRARRSSASTASPTTTRARSRKRTSPRTRGAQGFRFVETPIQDADLPALLDGVTHVFHLAAQAGVRKSWGKDFRPTPRTTSRRRSCCSRRASGVRSSGSCTRRARRSTATARRSRCAKTRCRSRCRRTASRSWRPSSSATSIT